MVSPFRFLSTCRARPRPFTYSSASVQQDLTTVSSVQGLGGREIGASGYAATSASQWLLGNAAGVVLDGTTASTVPKYLALGEARAIASGGGLAAVATASGQTIVIDPQSKLVRTTISLVTDELNSDSQPSQMSTDGTVLAGVAESVDSKGNEQQELEAISLPAGTLVNNWTYVGESTTLLYRFSLAGSGTLIGQVTGPAGLSPAVMSYSHPDHKFWS
jgi:hypothetical protein